MRRALELHWPALLVSSACAGLALSIRVSLPLGVAATVVLGTLVAVLWLDGLARVAGLALVLAVLGLAWGSLRMEALGSSVLTARLGESGQATLVTVAPARRSPWSTRVIAVTLLVLPVGRSPPRGAILEATVSVGEPRPARDGFDERAWLERQGVHVVLEASSWRQLGRRGGIPGLGDRLRDRIERAIGRGSTGIRRGVVLGVVLGEDEGLPVDVQHDFRASGLYHLLRDSAISRKDVKARRVDEQRERLHSTAQNTSTCPRIRPLAGVERKQRASVA